MPNTTNYSFPTPADTDLVKNGADAIRDLGDAVDTAMNTALGTKKAGLVLLNTTSFTTSASVSLTANSFSSSYENYKLIFNFTAFSTADLDVSFRLRTSTTDATGTDYFSERIRNSNTVLSGTRSASANTWVLGSGSSGGGARNFKELTLYSPQASVQTSFSVTGNYVGSGATGLVTEYLNGYHNLTTSYDSITFFPGAGTMSGTVYLYGVNK
jgi:hypothetical protein